MLTGIRVTLGTGKKPTEIRTNLDGKQMAALHEYHKYSNMCSNAFTKFNDGPKSVLVTETNFLVMAYWYALDPAQTRTSRSMRNVCMRIA